MVGESWEGWSNRATWAAWLEINNNYDMYQWMQTYCKTCIKEGIEPTYIELVNVLGIRDDWTSSRTKFVSKEISFKELNEALADEVLEIKRFAN